MYWMADSVLQGGAVWLGGFQHFWLWGQLITGTIAASMGNMMDLGRLSEVLKLVSGLVCQLITGTIAASMGNRMDLGRLSEVLKLVSGLVEYWLTGRLPVLFEGFFSSSRAYRNSV